MNYWLAGWKALHRERRDHKETQRAYDELVIAHQRALVSLRQEEQRAADMALHLSEPCPMCSELERERNNAILDLDTCKADLDDLHAALAWLERDFKVQ